MHSSLFLQGICALFAFSGKLNWKWEVLVLQRLQIKIMKDVAGEEEDHLTAESGAAGYGEGLRRQLGNLMKHVWCAQQSDLVCAWLSSLA